MSNRAKWAHWKRPKSDKYGCVKRWLLGIVCLAMGVLLLLSALEGFDEHILWFRSFSFVYGRPAVASTVGLLVLGSVLILVGVASFIFRE